MRLKWQDVDILFPTSTLKGHLRLCGLSDIEIATLIAELMRDSESQHWSESDLYSTIAQKLQMKNRDIVKSFDTIVHYEDLRRRVENIPPIVLIIEGASATGKSMIALETFQAIASTRFISTDTIRQVLRGVLLKEDYPELHCHTYQAHQFQKSGNIQLNPIIRGFLSQCQHLTPYIIDMVSRITSEGATGVVEGVHIIPGSVTEVSTGVLEVLINPNYELHKSMFFSKSMEGKLRSVTSDEQIRSEEFTATRVIQEYMVEQAEKHNIATVKLRDYDQACQEIYRLIIHKMRNLINSNNQ